MSSRALWNMFGICGFLWNKSGLMLRMRMGVRDEGGRRKLDQFATGVVGGGAHSYGDMVWRHSSRSFPYQTLRTTFLVTLLDGEHGHRISCLLPWLLQPTPALVTSPTAFQDLSPSTRAAHVRKLPSNLRTRIDRHFAKLAGPPKESDETAYWIRVADS